MTKKEKALYGSTIAFPAYSASALIRSALIPPSNIWNLQRAYTIPEVDIVETIKKFEKVHPKKVLYIDARAIRKTKNLADILRELPVEFRKLNDTAQLSIAMEIKEVSGFKQPRVISMALDKKFDAIISNRKVGGIALYHELGHLATNAKYKILDTRLGAFGYKHGITTLIEERLANKNIPKDIAQKYKKEIEKLFVSHKKKVLGQRGKAALVLSLPMLFAAEYYRTRRNG